MLVRMNEERGIALVVVMLVMLVLVSLSVAVVEISTESGKLAGYDQRRVESVQAAETGLADFLGGLGSVVGVCGSSGPWYCQSPATSSTYKICALQGVITTLTNTPTANYTLDITLHSGKNGAGTHYQCPPTPKPGGWTAPAGYSEYTGSTALKSAIITATGVGGTTTRNSIRSTRRFEQMVNLTPVVGDASSSAIYGASDVEFGGRSQVHEDGQNDANVYSGGDCSGFVAAFRLEGSLVCRGTITGVSGTVTGNVWAGTGIVAGLGNACIGTEPDCGGGPPEDEFGYLVTASGNMDVARIDTEHSCTAVAGNVTLNTGRCEKINSSQSVTVDGVTCAQSKTTACTGVPFVNSNSCPASVAAVTEYGKSLCSSLANFPTITFPEFVWPGPAGTGTRAGFINSPPTGLGYTEYVPTSCADALTKITAFPAGKTLFNMWGMNCPLTFSGLGDVQLNGDMAIVTDSSVTFSNRNLWTSANDAAYNLRVIHPSSFPTASSPNDASTDTQSELDSNLCKAATTTGKPDEIVIGNLTGFGDLIAYFYTPCKVWAENNSDMSGQIIAGAVSYTGNGNIFFAESLVPGVAPVGYTAAPIYLREVKAS